MNGNESLTPKVIVTTTKEHHLILTREMLITLLRTNNLRISDDAVIYAGDAVINSNVHVEVKWKTTEKSG